MIEIIPQEKLKNEMEVAFKIIDSLGYMRPYEGLKVIPVSYKNPDGILHLAFVTKKTLDNKEKLEEINQQLHDIYDNFLLSGKICMERANLSYKHSKQFSDLYNGHLHLDEITVASLLQILYFYPTDLKLMSRLMHWTYTGC